MELLDQYFNLEKQIHDYFGYKEGWCVISIDDRREMYWYLEQEMTGHGYVHFAETLEELQTGLETEEGEYYKDEIFTYVHLEKFVFVGKDYTMICVNTNTDGNKFLAIYDNLKRYHHKEKENN